MAAGFEEDGGEGKGVEKGKRGRGGEGEKFVL